MSPLSNLRSALGRKTEDPSSVDEIVTAPDGSQSQSVTEKGGVTETAGDAEKTDDDILPDQDAQHGVRKIEAVTLAWTKTSLAALLALIWILFLTNGIRLSIFISLSPYVTSDFQSHSLLAVIGIVSDAMVSAIYIPMAKMLDIWGRAESFLLMSGFATLGLILMAVSTNLTTYCAAQVFYSVGFNGIIFAIVVLAADATSLKNRGLAFAFTSSPYMITAFAGAKAAEGFLGENWRWGFGAFAIILPAVTSPLYGVLKLNQRKAEKRGLIASREKSGRSIFQKIQWFLVQADALGVLLFAGGFTVFLLPFTLARSAPNGWETDYIIAMLVTGFVVLIIFGLYQVYLAPYPFLKHTFLTDRTVMGACLVDLTYQMSYSSWNAYFTSFLQVVCNLTVAEAGYVNSTFQVVSGVLLFIVGYGIRRTCRFKWLFFLAVPFYILGLGLMIYFRQPNQYIGYIIMCEIFISVGGAVFILGMQVAVLAAVDHQHVAAALALLFVSGTIGSAIGSTISGAIWTNSFLPALMDHLPESALEEVISIYSDLTVQLAYPVNSPERIGIQMAYGVAQRNMVTAGTAISVLILASVFLMRNLEFKTQNQTKGTVF